MLWKLVLLLTVVPLVELALLLELTRLWGSVTLTMALVVGTGVLGAVLAKAEGLRVLSRMREQLSRGELPANSLIDGVLILIAGALLVTPGIITDFVGFLLLIPPSRAVVREVLKRRFRAKLGFPAGRGGGRDGWEPISPEPPAGSPPMEDEE